MRKADFTEEHIIGIEKEAEPGVEVAGLSTSGAPDSVGSAPTMAEFWHTSGSQRGFGSAVSSPGKACPAPTRRSSRANGMSTAR